MSATIERPALMACGCAPMATHKGEHDGLASDHWSCLIHGCCEALANAPSLEGRKSRCAYWTHGGCRSEQPSDAGGLAFFKYRGPGSEESRTMCKCGFAEIAHQPYWTATLEIDRNWYKLGRRTETLTRQGHAFPGTETAWAEGQTDFFRSQTHREESRVFGVRVVSLVPARSTMKCRTFTAKGPSEFDEHYCGCREWD